MSIAANLLISIVALIHIYILFLEMFLWTKPCGLRTFGMSMEKAKNSAVLAANQGVYNGFLAAGLIWGLLHPSKDLSDQIKVFFLLCVGIAGIYGAYSTKNKRIFFIQTVPAISAIILTALK